MNKASALVKKLETLIHAPIPGNAFETARLVMFDVPTNGITNNSIIRRVSSCMLAFGVY